jgi:hypothetical protein
MNTSRLVKLKTQLIFKSSFLGTLFMHTRLFANVTTSPAEQVKKLFAEINSKRLSLLVKSNQLLKECNEVKAEKLKAEEAVKTLMLKEDQLRKQINLINTVDCEEIRALFEEKFKAMDSKDVPNDLVVESCTHDIGNDMMTLSVKSADREWRVGDLLETTLLNRDLVGGTGFERTNSGYVQRQTLRNYPYNTDRDVCQEILEALTGVKLSENTTLSVSQSPSPTGSRL